MKIKRTIKKIISPFVPTKLKYGYSMYKHARHIGCSQIDGIPLTTYFLQSVTKLQCISYQANKADQIVKLIDAVEIKPVKDEYFFYSLDCMKSIQYSKHIFDNYSVDYGEIVHGSFAQIRAELGDSDDIFSRNELKIIDVQNRYYKRIQVEQTVCTQYGAALDAIGSLFERSAQTFFEGLQRILFFNQFIWQTGHKNIGFGHLDWILGELYQNDIETGRITEIKAREMLKHFFLVLHENYWFKSSALLGDTGQIIILGGKDTDGTYHCNELTYLLIEIVEELKLTEPKVLLRCSADMPDELWKMALKCIATGIGEPFLSNDDAVISALIDFGYTEKNAYQYVTSACWEPLIAGESCDQNNMRIFNFAIPFVDMLDHMAISAMGSMKEIIDAYEKELVNYTKKNLMKLSVLEFEEDPLFSLVSQSSRQKKKDLLRGGAKFANMGLTSVGLGTVVNSLLNIDRLVFQTREYTLSELNELRKSNFQNQDRLVKKLKSLYPCLGSDDQKVIAITKEIMNVTENEFSKYHTKYGGKFKFGLSSPGYIWEADQVAATFDGRRNGEPFSVHISASQALATTELFSFASQLDYTGLKCNGNVVDFVVSPEVLKQNMDKYITLIKVAFSQGVYQMQMNVVSSQTLIAAKEHPEQFPNLIVRVWGFSAYFKDLPEEYKDVLIQRAIEAEKAA